jgi:hypothetical protein
LTVLIGGLLLNRLIGFQEKTGILVEWLLQESGEGGMAWPEWQQRRCWEVYIVPR